MDPGQADTARAIALFLVAVSVASFPAAVFRQGRVWSAWLAVVGCEIFMAANIGSIGAHWHDPELAWYRVPASIAASAFMIAFAIQVFTTTGGGTRE